MSNNYDLRLPDIPSITSAFCAIKRAYDTTSSLWGLKFSCRDQKPRTCQNTEFKVCQISQEKLFRQMSHFWVKPQKLELSWRGHCGLEKWWRQNWGDREGRGGLWRPQNQGLIEGNGYQTTPPARVHKVWLFSPASIFMPFLHWGPLSVRSRGCLFDPQTQRLLSNDMKSDGVRINVDSPTFFTSEKPHFHIKTTPEVSEVHSVFKGTHDCFLIFSQCSH